jgi:signal transduction histidine kinase
MASNVQMAPAPKSSGFSLRRISAYFLAPRSTNRDEAFRERTMRAILVILVLLLARSLYNTFFVFHNTLELVSFPSMLLGMFLLSVTAWIAISYRQITLAGIFLVAAVVLAAVGASIIPGDASLKNIVNSIYLVAIVLAAVVLPRSWLIPFAILCSVLLGITVLADAPTDPKSRSTVLVSVIGVGVVEFIAVTLFLRELRREFDDRLTAERTSFQAAEKARTEADIQRQAAEKARTEADEANRAKSQFLANMSHELRTPLNAIIGYTEIMLGGMAGTFTDKQTELQKYVQSNAKRLLALINDILDLAKIESGTIEITATLTSPRKVIGDAVSNMQSLAQTKNIYLKATFSEDVPEAVLTDVGKVQQIITNLVGNAVKFTSEGGVEVKVGPAAKNGWQIAVIDTGRGMPTDAVNYIFETFRQVDASDSREQKGTGLGLAITKRLVDKLGGTINVTTEVGKGSTFTVVLPRVEQTAKEAKEEMPARA